MAEYVRRDEDLISDDDDYDLCANDISDTAPLSSHSVADDRLPPHMALSEYFSSDINCCGFPCGLKQPPGLIFHPDQTSQRSQWRSKHFVDIQHQQYWFAAVENERRTAEKQGRERNAINLFGQKQPRTFALFDCVSEEYFPVDRQLQLVHGIRSDRLNTQPHEFIRKLALTNDGANILHVYEAVALASHDPKDGDIGIGYTAELDGSFLTSKQIRSRRMLQFPIHFKATATVKKSSAAFRLCIYIAVAEGQLHNGTIAWGSPFVLTFGGIVVLNRRTGMQRAFDVMLSGALYCGESLHPLEEMLLDEQSSLTLDITGTPDIGDYKNKYIILRVMKSFANPFIVTLDKMDTMIGPMEISVRKRTRIPMRVVKHQILANKSTDDQYYLSCRDMLFVVGIYKFDAKGNLFKQPSLLYPFRGRLQCQRHSQASSLYPERLFKTVFPSVNKEVSFLNEQHMENQVVASSDSTRLRNQAEKPPIISRVSKFSLSDEEVEAIVILMKQDVGELQNKSENNLMKQMLQKYNIKFTRKNMKHYQIFTHLLKEEKNRHNIIMYVKLTVMMKEVLDRMLADHLSIRGIDAEITMEGKLDDPDCMYYVELTGTEIRDKFNAKFDDELLLSNSNYDYAAIGTYFDTSISNKSLVKITKAVYQLFENYIGQYKWIQLDARLHVDRIVSRQQYRALQLNCDLDEYLTPSTKQPPNKPLQLNIDFLNEYQLNAVQNALRPTGRYCYLIEGPPGTGKTKTLLGIPYAVASGQVPRQRIVIVTNTNRCADDIAKRLMNIQNKYGLEMKVLRWQAMSRKVAEIGENILGCSNIRVKQKDKTKKEVFWPSQDQVREADVVIATPKTLTNMSSLRNKVGHFGIMLIDEANKMNEPEMAMCINTITYRLSHEQPDSTAIIVAAGDIHQMGPYNRQPVLGQLGLDCSTMMRLMTTNALYIKPFKPQFITRLEYYYRGEIECIGFSNVTWYDGVLRYDPEALRENSPEKAGSIRVHLYDITPDADALQQSSMGSWSNASEVSLIKTLVDNYEKAGFNRSEMVILTPYCAQVSLMMQSISNVRVSTITSFEGEESPIVLFSLARATQFSMDERAFNVAVSRSKQYLCVVANVYQMRKFSLGRKFIEYVTEQNGYVPSVKTKKQQ